MEKNKIAKEVKAKTTAFVNDRKNANNLIDILAHSESEDEEVISECVRSFNTIFSLLVSQGEMYFASLPKDQDDLKDLNAEEKYKIWLRERYTEARFKLLQWLTHDSLLVQKRALGSIIKFLESESITPLTKIPNKNLSFPATFFGEFLSCLLSSDVEMTAIIVKFQEYLVYDDVRYYTMKVCLKHMKDAVNEKRELSSIYLTNVVTLLENLAMPQPGNDEKLTKFFSKVPDNAGNLKICTLKEHKKLFTSVWLEFLKIKLTTSIYKRVLVGIADKVIPHMTSPLLLADFLTASYNIGGAISLLALHSLFILVHSFNLDYPNFFMKLYGLFHPSIFHVKYRARFFFLSDMFLTSTHLPAYLVAAFIKRLSRLLLTAPPSGVSLALPFIYNLLKRHPECKVLIHRTDDIKDMSSDPYDMDESDPAKCNALESSLWEIKTLQDHYHHSVSTEAKKINFPIGAMEEDIAELLEMSTGDIFQKEVKKKIKVVPVTFEPPHGLFGTKNDEFSNIWELD